MQWICLCVCGIKKCKKKHSCDYNSFITPGHSTTHFVGMALVPHDHSCHDMAILVSGVSDITSQPVGTQPNQATVKQASGC